MTFLYHENPARFSPLAIYFRPDPGIHLGAAAMAMVSALAAGGYRVELHGEDRFAPLPPDWPLCVIRDEAGKLIALRYGATPDEAVGSAYSTWFHRPQGVARA